MKTFKKNFFIVVVCSFGIFLQSCWKDKTVKDKGLEDIYVRISPTYGVPLVSLRIRGGDVVGRINKYSATNAFFVEYYNDVSHVDLCVLAYDKTNIPVVISPTATSLDTTVSYPLDFFGDLRKTAGWTPLEAYAMMYVDNSYTSNFNFTLKDVTYDNASTNNLRMLLSVPPSKTGYVNAATTSGVFKRTLAIDRLPFNVPAIVDVVFNGERARVNFEVSSSVPPGNNGKLNLNPIIKLPMHITVENFVRRDTVAMSFESIMKYVDKKSISIEAITLYIKAINALPLDADVQIYFADTNYRVLDSIRVKDIFVAAGIANPSTYLIQTPITSEEAVSMEKEKLKRIQNTRFMIIRELFTSKDKSGTVKDVKLFKSNYMDVILSAKVEANINGKIKDITDEINNYDE